MDDDNRRQGLAIQAIQEAYLSMEHAHRDYRRARDETGDDDLQEPKAAYQDAVLTFYELVRPYLKAESQLSAYWHGQIPQYPDTLHSSIDAAVAYYQDNGVGIYQVQRHLEHVSLQQTVLTDGGSEEPQTADQWHQVLGRPETNRIVAIEPGESQADYYVRELRFAVLGLRELDFWRAQVVTERSQGSGFMASESSVRRRLEYEPAQKITQAKRMLTEAANNLGALPDYEMEDTRDAGFDYSDLLGGGDE